MSHGRKSVSNSHFPTLEAAEESMRNENERQTFLGNTTTFSYLGDLHIERLAKYTKIVTYKPDEFLITEGTRSDRFFIIVFGLVGVYVELSNSPRTIKRDDTSTQLTGFDKPQKALAKWGSGTTIGETCLLSERLTTATVVASTGVVALVLLKEDIEHCLSNEVIDLLRYSFDVKQFTSNMRFVEDALVDEYGRRALINFTESRHCSEIIEFYLSGYKYAEETDLTLRESLAKSIWERYIKPKAEQEVNVSTEVRENIERKIFIEHKFEDDLFRLLLSNARKDINQDIVPRFQTTAEYDMYINSKIPLPVLLRDEKGIASLNGAALQNSRCLKRASAVLSQSSKTHVEGEPMSVVSHKSNMCEIM